MLDWAMYAGVLVCLPVALFLTLINLPGIWVIVAAAGLYTYFSGAVHMGWTMVVVVVVLGVLAEIVEFLASGAGAKAAGGGWRSFLGATVGGIVGGIVGTFALPVPVIGSLVGVCVGTFGGAMLAETSRGTDAKLSMSIGWGATKGRVAGIVGKLGFGVAMALCVAIAAFPWGVSPLAMTRTVPPAAQRPVAAPLPAPTTSDAPSRATTRPLSDLSPAEQIAPGDPTPGDPTTQPSTFRSR